MSVLIKNHWVTVIDGFYWMGERGTLLLQILQPQRYLPGRGETTQGSFLRRRSLPQWQSSFQTNQTPSWKYRTPTSRRNKPSRWTSMESSCRWNCRSAWLLGRSPALVERQRHTVAVRCSDAENPVDQQRTEYTQYHRRSDNRPIHNLSLYANHRHRC